MSKKLNIAKVAALINAPHIEARRKELRETLSAALEEVTGKPLPAAPAAPVRPSARVIPARVRRSKWV